MDGRAASGKRADPFGEIGDPGTLAEAKQKIASGAPPRRERCRSTFAKRRSS